MKLVKTSPALCSPSASVLADGLHAGGAAQDGGRDLGSCREAERDGADDDRPHRIFIAVMGGRVRVTLGHAASFKHTVKRVPN
jgi:hypothetical protein